MLFDTTAQITLFSLILMRMSGFILLNPILGRRNIPMQVKAGFIFILTVTVYSFSTGDAFDITNPLEYGLLLFKEFAAGYAIGFVTELFFFVITFAGYVMDFQMGMSMSTVYDPQSNAQVPITGSLLQAFSECVVLGIKFAFPVLAAEFLVEIGVGILNKIVPQINVFVINIQLKVIVGLGLLVLLISPIGEYLSNLVTVMVKAIQEILTFL